MRPITLTFVPAVALAVAACGPTTPETTEPVENAPPEWADAPEARVTLGQGQTRKLPADIRDAEGDAIEVTFVAPPGIDVAIDAELSTVTVHADYLVAGPVDVEVTLADAEGKSTVTLGLDVKPIAWLARTTWTEAAGPEAREHASMLLAGDRLVLFGGSGYSPYGEVFADAWSYSLATDTWSSLAVEGAVPDPAGSRRAAAAAEPGVAYLFGGYGENTATNRDLFRVTIGDAALSFEEIEQVNPPPRRALHAFVRDPGSNRFIVFGGFGTKVLGDTWIGTVDGATATWTELRTPVAPTPRYGFFYGVDEATRRLIVWSGAQGTAQIDPAGDVWALDLTVDPPVWSLVLDAAAPGAPPGRRNGCFIFDPSGPRLAVFGGTADAMTSEPGLWMLDLRPGRERWDRVERPDEPPVRSSGFGAVDASGKIRLGFGNTSQAVFRDLAVLGYAD